MAGIGNEVNDANKHPPVPNDERRWHVPTWAQWLGFAVVIISMASATYYMYLFQGSDWGRYTLAVLLLFFALSTVSTLLFAGNATLSGSALGVTFTLVGPAVIWIVGSFLWFKFLVGPDEFKRVESEFTVGKLAELTNDLEQRSDGTLSFAEYKRGHSEYVDILDGKAVEKTIQQYLNYAYEPVDRPGSSYGNLRLATISTIFVYTKMNFVIKLQRIQGTAADANSPPRIPYAGSPSFSQANPDAARKAADMEYAEFPYHGLYIRDMEDGGAGRFDLWQKPVAAENGYAILPSQVVDCLQISWYTDLFAVAKDREKDQDYIVIPTRRFVAKQELASVALTIVGAPNGYIPEENAWAIRRPFAPLDGTSPVRFKVVGKRGELRANALEKAFGDWMAKLDREIAERGESKDGTNDDEKITYLRGIRALLTGNKDSKSTFVNWLKAIGHGNDSKAYSYQDGGILAGDIRTPDPIVILLRRKGASF